MCVKRFITKKICKVVVTAAVADVVVCYVIAVVEALFCGITRSQREFCITTDPPILLLLCLFVGFITILIFGAIAIIRLFWSDL